MVLAVARAGLVQTASVAKRFRAVWKFRFFIFCIEFKDLFFMTGEEMGH